MALTRYGELRNQLLRQTFPTVFAPVVLRDADHNYVPLSVSERLVQCIWYDQRLQPDSLQTTDGRRVRVIFPGWWNLEAGPDFRHATIQIGDEAERKGDIEIHLRAEDWLHHGHGRDPQYDNVMLHVVLWEDGRQTPLRSRHGEPIPQVVLQHQLAAPLEALYDEIDVDAYPHNAGSHTGPCGAIFRQLAPEVVSALLDSAGDERFAAKLRKFSRWIHRAGAEQAFYEGWMEALGYKANKSPFRSIAQRLPIKEGPATPAVFFGVAGFLPVMATRDAYTKRLWNAWWKVRPDFEERILPAEAWRLHGIRPVNHPHRRLGAAIALLKHHRGQLLEKTVGAIESGGDPAKLFLQVRDDYWSRHCTLGGRAQTRASELIGASRAEEIVANVVLPFVAAYAEDSGDARLAGKVKVHYDALRAAPSNSMLRLASQQLFDNAAFGSRFLKTARRQQGLMQVFQDFCLNDKSVCATCQFPELVQRWAGLSRFEAAAPA